MRILNQWSRSRFPWFLLLLFIAGTFGYAWHVQYGENLPPCYYCVMDRYYFSFVALAGLVGMIKPSNVINRLVAVLLYVYGSLMGVFNSIHHLNYLSDPNPFKQCPVQLSTFIPVQNWIPQFFTPTGNCDSYGPTILSFTMVQLTAICFVGLFIVAVLVLISQVFNPRQNPFGNSMNRKMF